MAEDLNLGRKRTNPANGQSGYRLRTRRIASPTRIPLGHADLDFLLHKLMLKKINEINNLFQILKRCWQYGRISS